MSIATDAALVAQGLTERLAQGQGHVFHGVVLVHLKVAAAGAHQREARVVRQLREHVVVEV